MYEIGNMTSAIHGGRTDTSYGMSDFVSVRRTIRSYHPMTRPPKVSTNPNIWSAYISLSDTVCM